MANRANVEALTVLLFQEQAAEADDDLTYAELRGSGFEVLAQRLADRGVLVVSDAVLTDEVAALIISGATESSTRTEAEPLPGRLREGLSRLAKGDTT